jgi:hypothetical protein
MHRQAASFSLVENSLDKIIQALQKDNPSKRKDNNENNVSL